VGQAVRLPAGAGNGYLVTLAIKVTPRPSACRLLAIGIGYLPVWVPLAGARVIFASADPSASTRKTPGTAAPYGDAAAFATAKAIAVACAGHGGHRKLVPSGSRAADGRCLASGLRVLHGELLSDLHDGISIWISVRAGQRATSPIVEFPDLRHLRIACEKLK